MNYKWIGALCIITACGGAGFSMAAAYRREERALEQLLRGMDLMAGELEFHLSPLPQLLRNCAQVCSGSLRSVLDRVVSMLEEKELSDVSECVRWAMAADPGLSPRVKGALELLGSSFGRFDLSGQKMGIESVRTYCRKELEMMVIRHDERLRG